MIISLPCTSLDKTERLGLRFGLNKATIHGCHIELKEESGGVRLTPLPTVIARDGVVHTILRCRTLDTTVSFFIVIVHLVPLYYHLVFRFQQFLRHSQTYTSTAAPTPTAPAKPTMVQSGLIVAIAPEPAAAVAEVAAEVAEDTIPQMC